ncbi:sensor histidine kinase [Vagococcus salmoninarum]|uniref:sensor histidine kinase n=1 Tax=Vagococcus salmoninarum TaxID=2739 RepID=UPI001881CF38|nr:ATP-binding protein [Vagococcus salmoninarum]MBE9389775.1 two-component sensor histidine kinase [Vagococcus salmoninarum]
MLNKMAIRLKFTVLTMLILSCCCIGLTIFTSLSGKRMSSQIASTLLPAQAISTRDSRGRLVMPAIAMTPSIDPAVAEKQREQEQILKNYYLTSASFMVLIIISGGLGAYYISGKGLVSLIELNTKIKNSSVDTLSDELALPLAKDEISDLTNSFNQMKRQLNESFVFQKQFSGNVAHELRTPLTVLKTKLAVFQRKELELSKETAVLVADLSKQVQRLIEMVEKLLQLTNDYQLGEESQILVSDLFENILADLGPMIEEKELIVTSQVTDQMITGDLDLLYQGFYNLLENSVKFNQQGGGIELSVNETLTASQISITDTGIGIPEEYREAVFQSLFRVDEGRDRKVGGSGLGLAIVQKIISKHQGKIEIVSNPQATQGTRVIVSLPKEKKLN